jgi:hypothetical protein
VQYIQVPVSPRFVKLIKSALLILRYKSLEPQFLIIYTDSVRTSQETHYVSATKPNRLILFRETVAVYCENHTEHTNTLRGQNI